MPLLILSLLRAIPWQVYAEAALVIAGMVYIHWQREDAAADAVREIREMSSRKPRSAARKTSYKSPLP